MKARAVRIEKAGPASNLKLVELDVPAPAVGEVQVKVHTAGVAGGDVARRSGMLPGSKFPYIPGYDIAGEVVAVGADVTNLSVGDMVTGACMTGGYSEVINVPAEFLVPFPGALLDPAMVSATVLNYMTAHQLLHRLCKVPDSGSVLIHGAAGGVGTAVLQVAKLTNITVYGTASAAKHHIIEAEGGNAIDYRTQDFVEVVRQAQPVGVDAAFDPIGGKNLQRTAKTIRRGGVLVALGVLSANDSRLNVPYSMLILGLSSLRMKATFYGYSNKNEWYREDLTHVLDLLATGQIKPVIGERLPLAEAAHAHELLEQRSVTGKIVLEMMG